MRKRIPAEIVTYRGGPYRGKVTARFTLHTGPSSWLHCVRVRWGHSDVEHYSADEFDRLCVRSRVRRRK